MTIKKIKIAIAFIALVLFNVNSHAQTTQEEYNYITKGYKVQIESGLDMKKGYKFVDMGEWSVTKTPAVRVCTFKALIKDGQTKPCAIMMVFKRTDVTNGANLYICIPSPNSAPEMWQQTLDFLSQNLGSSTDALLAVNYALMKLAAQEASK